MSYSVVSDYRRTANRQLLSVISDLGDFSGIGDGKVITILEVPVLFRVAIFCQTAIAPRQQVKPIRLLDFSSSNETIQVSNFVIMGDLIRAQSKTK